MQDLKIFQCPTGIFQLPARLAQLADELAGQKGDGQIGKQVHKNDRLQRLQFRVGGAVGAHNPVVVEFEDSAIQDEGQRRNQVRPHSRQQDSGYDDDQRIEKVQRTVPAAGFVHHQADHDQIGEHLQGGLQAVLAPERHQHCVEE